MKKFFLYLLTSMLCLSYSSFALALDVSSPVGMMQSLAEKMIENLKSNKTNLNSNPALVYSLAYKIVVPHADLDEMARRVLPPHTWNSATASQRKLFENEFTTLLVRTYASALADYSDQSVRFYPIRGGIGNKKNVRVDSQITRNDGPSIFVHYQLILKGTEWKLYDMTVEGISLLSSFRSQFGDKLSHGSINDLITYLKQHNSQQAGN